MANQSSQPVSPQPQRPVTRFEAQRHFGLFAPLDYTVLAVILCAWVTLGFWKLFGDPDVLKLIAAVLFTITLQGVWLLILAYRILVFILDLHADVALMPEAAARVVVGYYQAQPGAKP